MIPIQVAAIALFAAGPLSVPAATLPEMQEPLRLFYRGVRTGNACILGLSLSPQPELEEETAESMGEPVPCILGFRIAASRQPTGGAGATDIEVLVRLDLDPKCYANDDKRTFALRKIGDHWKIKSETKDWWQGPETELKGDVRSESYERVVTALPEEETLCRSIPRPGRTRDSRRASSKAVLHDIEEAKKLGRQLERAIRARDMVAVMQFAPREGIPCGQKTISYPQMARELRTPGAPLNAYLFDERTFNEKYARSQRPMSIAEFFRLEKDTDISVVFSEGPCVTYHSLKTKARPTVCFRRGEKGWVYAGGREGFPFSLYPCE